MPELPEVEVSRQGLLPFLPGRRIVEAVFRAPRLRHEIPGQLSSRLAGLRIDGILRRGKYLLFDCESRQHGGWLILHLGMSGSLRLVVPGTPPQKHDFGSHLAQCEYFTVDAKKGAFDGAADEKSFVSLLITDGAGTLTCGGETVKVKKGESYFIPAGSGKYAVTGDCETLVTVV